MTMHLGRITFTPVLAQTGKKTNKPNILVIMADDIDWFNASI